MTQRYAWRPSRWFGGTFLVALVAPLIAATPLSPVYAQHSSDGHSGGGRGGGQSMGGGHTSGGHTEDDAGHEDEGHEGGKGARKGRSGGGAPPGGAARGGHGAETLQDKILRSGRPSMPGRGGSSAGRPVWAGGAVPEDLELGRLNVARAPENVLGRALAEVYAVNLDKNGDGILDADADLAAIDSPRANLALYREAISGTRRVAGAWTLDQAAVFLGKASDKNIPVSTDTVTALNVILETPADFSTYSYDRSTAYPDKVASVFAGNGYSGTGLVGFAQAADDARAIALFEHDHPTE